MKSNPKNEQTINSSNEQVVTAKVPYEAPEVTVMGKVEQLTAVLRRGPRDILRHGNLL